MALLPGGTTLLGAALRVPHPSASDYTSLPEAEVLKNARFLQEFETELKTATDDAVDDAAKTLEEKKEELR